MPRKREIPSSHVELFSKWRDALRVGALRPSTAASYETDVAAFLRFLGSKKLGCARPELLATFLRELLPRRKSRMLSALTDFFVYANAQGLQLGDPLRNLKYRRCRSLDPRQTTLLDLLTASEAGDAARHLIWADFVAPMLSDRRMGLRVGKKVVSLKRPLYKELQETFRLLASRHDLGTILKRRIA